MTAVFVFGSNLAGKHAGGAARFAYEDRGAAWGEGEGHFGDSYALPTMDADFRPMQLDHIAEHVRRFIRYAEAHPELTFEVTPVGCGIAGFKPAEIGPMFAGAPDNCAMPVEFGGVAK